MNRLNEKLRILLANNGWTQRELGERMNVSTSTVQKWVSGKNMPTTVDATELCKIFGVSLQALLDDSVPIYKYRVIDKYLPYSETQRLQDGEHTIIDAGLKNGGLLHRFVNAGGAECSAIYQSRIEVFWHYREYEADMIKTWNESYE